MAVTIIKAPIVTGVATPEQSIFNTAASFHEAAIRASEPIRTSTGENSPTSPMITCYAFAAELYLKSLLAMDGSTAISGHRLNVLYARLSATTRASIEARITAALNVTGKEFEELLQRLSAAFVEWRYIYELRGGRHIEVGALSQFVRELYLTVRTKQPDWPIDGYMDGRLGAEPQHGIVFVVTGERGALVRAVNKAVRTPKAAP